MVDTTNGDIFSHNEHSHSLAKITTEPIEMNLCNIISLVGHDKQNVVYCNSRQKVVDYAKEYADRLPIKNDFELESLAKDIANEVHIDCFLAELIRKGVAYHVGYLPASIRLRIEKGFEKGLISLTEQRL